MLCVEPYVESVNNLCLVIRTCDDANCPVVDGKHGLGWRIRCVATAGTLDPTGWLVMQELSCVVGGEPTDRGKLFKMGITAEKGNRELIQQEK